MTIKEYNECVKLYSDGLYRFVLKSLANQPDAEDVVQNTFEKCWRNREKVDAKKAKSFLFTVAYHDLIDLTRKKKFVSHLHQLPEKTEQDFSRRLDARQLIDKGLEEVNDIQRNLILLRDYEGYSYEEIAEITELSISQVKVYLFRGRKKLQKALNQLDEGLWKKKSG